MNQIADDDNVEFRGGTLQLNGDVNITGDPSNLAEGENAEPVAILLSSPNRQLAKMETKCTPAVLTGVDTLSTMTTSSDQSEGFNFLSDNQNAVTSRVDFPFSSDNIQNYFTYRNGLLENAVRDCIAGLIFPDSDGEVVGSWLMTEISLWDHEKERLVILTTRMLIHIKYDFIALRKLDFKKVPLTQIDTIVLGDLVYPPASLVPRINGLANGLVSVKDHFIDKWLKTNTQECMEANNAFNDNNYFEPRDRNVRGVRVMWNNGQPLPFVKKWNPFNEDIPFLTYTSHPMFWHKGAENGPDKRYDSDDLGRSLIEAVENTLSDGSPYKILNAPIVLQNYVGVTSLVHNKTSLGFFKVRGKFSF